MGTPFALLASPRRREILRLIWREERSAGEVHGALGDVTAGAVSQHLAALVAAGVATVRAEGRQRFYRARRAALRPFAATLKAMWDDALYRLKLRAELEASRRGPRPRRRKGRRSS